MKKWTTLSILAGVFYVSQAVANPLICPFTDYFDIHATSELTATVLSAEGNVVVSKLDAKNFVVSCKSNTSLSSGHVYLTVKWADANICTLHILDGPYEMNPSVVFNNCSGHMVYEGMDHEWGSYHYTLKFIERARNFH